MRTYQFEKPKKKKEVLVPVEWFVGLLQARENCEAAIGEKINLHDFNATSYWSLMGYIDSAKEFL